MAQLFSQMLFSKPTTYITTTKFLFSRSISSAPTAPPPTKPTSYHSLPLLLRRLCSLAASSVHLGRPLPAIRSLPTSATSPLNDQNLNRSNRPPKETILPGRDFEHWFVGMKPPEKSTSSRDEIIDYYILTLASVLGSVEEARKKIYSVSTRCYFAFGALVPKKIAQQLIGLPRVRYVMADSYEDVENKEYKGEPFINGHAVKYEPKYHWKWMMDYDPSFKRYRINERRRQNIPTSPPPSSMKPLPGRDFEHWLVGMKPHEKLHPSRDEIIDYYIQTLALALGSVDEAVKKIYSVSTKFYFAFGVLVPLEFYQKLIGLPRVRYIIADYYEDVENQTYGGEPFINGKAVPYHPKYHLNWK